MLLSRSIDGGALDTSGAQLSGPQELTPKAHALLLAADAGAQKHLAEQELWGEVDQETDCGHWFGNARAGRKAPTQNTWFA